MTVHNNGRLLSHAVKAVHDENLGSVHSLPDLTYGSVIDVSQITESQENKTEQKHIVPDGGYGWVVVFAAFCSFNIIGAHMMGFALVYWPMIEGFDENYAVVGWVGSVSQAMCFIPGFFFATMVVKLGSRLTCIIGSILAGIGLIATAFAPNVYTVYLTYGVFGGSGMGMMFIANVVIVQQYFDKKRGKAAGIAMAGLSFGTIVGAAILFPCIQMYGWRGALLIVGAFNLNGIVFGSLQRPPFVRVKKPKSDIYLGKTMSAYASKDVQDPRQKNALLSDQCQNEMEISVPGSLNTQSSGKHNQSLHSKEVKHPQQKLLLKDSDKTQNVEGKCSLWMAEMFDFTILKNPNFLIYCISTMFMNIGMMCFYMHSPNRALHYGVSSSKVALLPPATGIFTLSSRIIFGFISDFTWVDRKVQYSLGVLLGAIAEITFVFSTTFPTIVMHCMLFGACNGIFLTVQSTVLVDILTVAKIAKSQALLGCFIGTSCLIATPFAGFLYDVTQDYNIPFLVTGSIQLFAGIMLLTAFKIKDFVWRK